jgi:DNA-binding NarL/FixJ family response regulator
MSRSPERTRFQGGVRCDAPHDSQEWVVQVQAIHDVHRGDSSLLSSVARKLLQALAGPSPPGPGNGPLTEREVEVLCLVAQGHSNMEIAHRLTISEATVRTHVSNILAKLDLCSRAQAALNALRQGLAPLHDTTPSPPA